MPAARHTFGGSTKLKVKLSDARVGVGHLAFGICEGSAKSLSVLDKDHRLLVDGRGSLEDALNARTHPSGSLCEGGGALVEHLGFLVATTQAGTSGRA